MQGVYVGFDLLLWWIGCASYLPPMSRQWHPLIDDLMAPLERDRPGEDIAINFSSRDIKLNTLGFLLISFLLRGVLTGCFAIGV